MRGAKRFQKEVKLLAFRWKAESDLEPLKMVELGLDALCEALDVEKIVEEETTIEFIPDETLLDDEEQP